MAKGAYIGVNAPTQTFADNTWEQIIYACRNNEVPDTWKIGDQKSMTIGDADYIIDIIGKHHDTYADGSGTAPLTFQLHDCYGTAYGMNASNTNSGGWTSCTMRATHLPSILALMPSEVQVNIKEVNKLTSAGGNSSTINTTADKLFLLSEVEVLGTNTLSFSGEGRQYDYYAAGNSKIKKIGSSRVSWRVRSPCNSNGNWFCFISDKGDASQGNSSLGLGVSFAFCFGGNPIPTTRKVKKGYIGVDGTARKIKKAYIGIGGVARPCWGGGKPTAYGAITALSAAKYYPAGASVGDYALFAGGGVSSGYSNTVDSYDKSLTRKSATTLTAARQQMFSGTVGGRALFAGGNDGHLY